MFFKLFLNPAHIKGDIDWFLLFLISLYNFEKKASLTSVSAFLTGRLLYAWPIDDKSLLETIIPPYPKSIVFEYLSPKSEHL